jgi:hypothetical protein
MLHWIDNFEYLIMAFYCKLRLLFFLHSTTFFDGIYFMAVRIRISVNREHGKLKMRCTVVDWMLLRSSMDLFLVSFLSHAIYSATV